MLISSSLTGDEDISSPSFFLPTYAVLEARKKAVKISEFAWKANLFFLVTRLIPFAHLQEEVYASSIVIIIISSRIQFILIYIPCTTISHLLPFNKYNDLGEVRREQKQKERGKEEKD